MWILSSHGHPLLSCSLHAHSDPNPFLMFAVLAVSPFQMVSQLSVPKSCCQSGENAGLSVPCCIPVLDTGVTKVTYSGATGHFWKTELKTWGFVWIGDILKCSFCSSMYYCFPFCSQLDCISTSRMKVTLPNFIRLETIFAHFPFYCHSL